MARAGSMWRREPAGPLPVPGTPEDQRSCLLQQTRLAATSWLLFQPQHDRVRLGGTGWIMFDVNAPKARWAGTLAMLGRSDDQQRCGKNYPVGTRTRRDHIAFPFIENEQPRLVTVDTIVSGRHDDHDPNAARLTERFYYGYNWGWLAGSVGKRLVTRPPIYLRSPCVSFSEYPSGGGENCRMLDCRMWTHIVPENADRTAQVGWP
jgi:hypothetical protein